ncbi:hypothetical protein [Polaromonas sp. YR568]|uniref:hypothetical protein n=1 Tax=Polaromonas sp. YR568 TaxID=1855301 RepID=UPI00398C116B
MANDDRTRFVPRRTTESRLKARLLNGRPLWPEAATIGQKQAIKDHHMRRLYPIPDDFEATIRILTAQEGGRTTPPRNGIRWDLSYELDSEPNQIWMVWPDFFDAAGDSLPINEPLPVDVPISARLTVLNDDLRKEIHGARIRVGRKFYCVEGSKRVAIGTVTRITGLHSDRKNGN